MIRTGSGLICIDRCSRRSSEQRQLTPDRMTHLRLPPDPRVIIFIDPGGWSGRDQLSDQRAEIFRRGEPVKLGWSLRAGSARVWVRDRGAGLAR